MQRASPCAILVQSLANCTSTGFPDCFLRSAGHPVVGPQPMAVLPCENQQLSRSLGLGHAGHCLWHIPRIRARRYCIRSMGVREEGWDGSPASVNRRSPGDLPLVEARSPGPLVKLGGGDADATACLVSDPRSHSRRVVPPCQHQALAGVKQFDAFARRPRLPPSQLAAEAVSLGTRHDWARSRRRAHRGPRRTFELTRDQP